LIKLGGETFERGAAALLELFVLPGREDDEFAAVVTGDGEGAAGGEAGAIAAPAALMNAITDALGVKDLPMPASPQTVWRAIRQGATAQAAE
jgi:hypothetical protein